MEKKHNKRSWASEVQLQCEGSFSMEGLIQSVQNPAELDELSQEEQRRKGMNFNLEQTKPKLVKCFV